MRADELTAGDTEHRPSPLRIDVERIRELLRLYDRPEEGPRLDPAMLPRGPALYVRKWEPADEGDPMISERDLRHACAQTDARTSEDIAKEFRMYPARDVAHDAVQRAEADLEAPHPEHTLPKRIMRLAQARSEQQAVLAAEEELRQRVAQQRCGRGRRRRVLGVGRPRARRARSSCTGAQRRPGVRRATRSTSTGPPGDPEGDAPGEPAPAGPHDALAVVA